MDSWRFDALTRRLAAGSRRQMMAALLAGALAHVLRPSEADDVAAACKGFNGKCKGSAGCCADDGYRCVKVGKGGKGGKSKKRKKRRCRCLSGTCPPQTPCCLGGKCEEFCDDACCADCFVPTDSNGQPMLNLPVCCVGTAGTVCGPNPKQKSDDHCCYPEEECLDGYCCCDGCRGSVVCGGECCAIAACCNGSCCPPGQVCATTPTGDQCVSADRPCNGGCFEDEECVDEVCCQADLSCDGVCCDVGEWCQAPNNVCCPINTSCPAGGSFKGHRVRR